MIFQRLRKGVDVSDRDFDAIFSQRMRQVSKFHFTPVAVARKAAGFLVSRPGARVLDIGSGAGKFCMVGAACTEGVFTGVEQRHQLVVFASLLARWHKLTNIRYIHANITTVEFRQFDAIYFYNSFSENIIPGNPLDDAVSPDKSLYFKYSQYMKAQLQGMPAGTRLVTYFSFMDEIPDSYKIVATDFDRTLKLWEKVS